jgi:hypothetical protein
MMKSKGVSYSFPPTTWFKAAEGNSKTPKTIDGFIYKLSSSERSLQF